MSRGDGSKVRRSAGQLVPPDSDGVVGRAAARWVFLQVLSDEAQPAIEDLYQAGAPLMRDPARRLYLAAGETSNEKVEKDLSRRAISEWKRRRDLEHVRLQEIVTTWGSRWRLADGWMGDVARQSLLRWGQRWAEDVESRAWIPALMPFALASDGAAPRSPDLEGRFFPGETEEDFLERLSDGRRYTWAGGVGPWLPGQETEAAYMRRVKQYTMAVHQAYRREGWKPAPRRRALRTHLRWVVRLHVLNWTVRKLCQSEGQAFDKGGKGDSAVRKAYRTTTALLDLTPRKDILQGGAKGSTA